MAEAAFHRTWEPAFIGICDDQARYVELLADFTDDLPDLGDEPSHPTLDPDPTVGCPAVQSFAPALGRAGPLGLVDLSVRHPGRRCLVAFEPSAVRNVWPEAG